MRPEYQSDCQPRRKKRLSNCHKCRGFPLKLEACIPKTPRNCFDAVGGNRNCLLPFESPRNLVLTKSRASFTPLCNRCVPTGAKTTHASLIYDFLRLGGVIRDVPRWKTTGHCTRSPPAVIDKYFRHGRMGCLRHSNVFPFGSVEGNSADGPVRR